LGETTVIAGAQAIRFQLIRRTAVVVCLVAAFSTLGPGAKGQITAPEPEEQENLSTSRIQSLVMDFSDQYSSAIAAPLDEFASNEPDPAKRVAAQALKVRYSSAAMTIASSRDPRTSLLDMVVFVSAAKWAMDSYWIPKVLGKTASPLADASHRMDEKVWFLAGRVLSLRQQSDLRELIKGWERRNPGARGVPDIRLRNLDGVHLSAFDDGLAARGILASVRKFLGRVDSSLLYGERMMFCLERTPRILSQQTELTLAQIGEAFPIATVKPDTLANAVKDLPMMLQAGLDRNEGSLKILLPQIATTLETANSLTANLDKTLLSVRDLTEKSGDSPLLRTDPAALLKDTNQALAHLDSSINGLNQLLEKATMGETKVEELSRQIDSHADHIMNGAFHRILVIIGVFFGGLLLVILLVAFLFRRGSKPVV
jgi:hypothetical protein